MFGLEGGMLPPKQRRRRREGTHSRNVRQKAPPKPTQDAPPVNSTLFPGRPRRLTPEMSNEDLLPMSPSSRVSGHLITSAPVLISGTPRVQPRIEVEATLSPAPTRELSSTIEPATNQRSFLRRNTEDKLQGLFGDDRVLIQSRQYKRNEKRPQQLAMPPGRIRKTSFSSWSSMQSEIRRVVKVTEAKDPPKMDDLGALLGGGDGGEGWTDGLKLMDLPVEKDPTESDTDSDFADDPFGVGSELERMVASGQDRTATLKESNVPIVDGIACTVLRPRQPWHIVVSEIISFILFCLAVRWAHHSLVVNDVIDLQAFAETTLDLRNCALGFYPGPKPLVRIRALLPRFESFDVRTTKAKPYEMDGERVHISVKNTHQSIYFQCTVNFELPEHFQFESLRVNYDSAEAYQDVYAETSVKARSSVDFNFHHAFVQLQSIDSPRIRMGIQDGWAKFALDGDESSYNFTDQEAIVLTSYVAPITIQTSYPIDLTMDIGVASRAFLKGRATETDLLNNDTMLAFIWPSGYESRRSASQMSISTIMKGTESPLYIIARTTGEDLSQSTFSGWIGNEHLKLPHLAPFATAKLYDVRDWVKDAGSRPWKINLPISTEHESTGIWKFFSGKALLGSSVYFSLFSAGFLAPTERIVPVHILGQFCSNAESHRRNVMTLVDHDEHARFNSSSRTDVLEVQQQTWINWLMSEIDKFEAHKPPSSNHIGRHVANLRPLSTCQTAIRDSELLVLWKALSDVRNTHTVFVWEDDVTRVQTQFQLLTDAILAQTVGWKTRLGFFFAIGLNGVIAIVSASVNVRWVLETINSVIYRDMECDEPVMRQQSHRLTHEIQAVPPVGWYIHVSSVVRPNPGLRIRWTQRLTAKRLAVIVQVVDTDWHHYVKDPIPQPFRTDRKRYLFDEKTESEDALSDETSPLLDSRTLFSSGIATRSSTSSMPDARKAHADSICVYLPGTTVKSVDTMSGSQREIELPLIAPPTRHRGHYALDSRHKWQLPSDQKLRVKVLALDENGHIKEESGWSSEIVPLEDITWQRSMKWMTKRLTASSMSSWSLFIRKCLVPITTDVLPLKLTQISFEMSKSVIRQLGNPQDLPVYSRAASGPVHRRGSIRKSTHTQTFPCHFILSGGWTRRVFLARRYYMATRRRVFSSIFSRGIAEGSPQAAGDLRWTFKFPTTDCLELDMDRASHRCITLEVRNGATGEDIATGMLDVRALLRSGHNEISSIPVEINLEQTGGGDVGTMWGLLRARLDASPLQKYIRGDDHSTSDVCDGELNLQPRRLSVIHFLNVSPGMTLINGKDFEVEWVWDAEETDTVYIHLIDHFTNEPIDTLAQGQAVPNTGTYFWAVDVEMDHREAFKVCYLAITSEPLEYGRRPQPRTQSHAFFVTRTLLLSELEYAYAAFCRTFDLDMEDVNERLLLYSGLTVTQEPIRVCPGLRRPLPFEMNAAACIHTPGQGLISSTTRLVVFRPECARVYRKDQLSHAQVFKSITRNVHVVHNVMIDPDPFYWVKSYDVDLLRLNVLNGVDLPSKAFRWVNRNLDRLIYGRTAFHERASTRRLAWWKKVTPESDSIQLRDHTRQLLKEHESHVRANIKMHFQVSRETDREFEIRRWITFELWGLVLQIPRLWHVYYCSMIMNVQALAFVIVINAITTVYLRRYHRGIDYEFFSDFIFEPRLNFLMRMPKTSAIVCVVLIIDFFLKWIAIVFRRFIRSKSTRLNWYIHLYGLVSISLLVVTAVAFLPAFFLWFILAALIDTDTCLPAAIMCGVSAYVIFSVWTSFTYARSYISDYITSNTNTLLTIVLDAWFETNNVVFQDTSLTFDAKDELNSEMVIKLEREIRKIRTRGYYVGKMLYDDRSTPKGAIKPEDVCVYKFVKVMPTVGNALWFDADLCPHGLQSEPSVAPGSRFATVRDYEMHSKLFKSMLLGYEAAMLADGVLHGPRTAYRLDVPPQPNSRYPFAIAAEPFYPPPDTLCFHTKVALLFDAFDRDGDKRLKEIEFTLWAGVLGVEIPGVSWSDVVLHFNREYRTNGTDRDGFTLADLEVYYNEVSDEVLDLHYDKLYKTRGCDKHEAPLLAIPRENLEEADSLDEDSDNENIQHRTEFEARSEDDEIHDLTRSRVSQEITEKLRNSSTARKLHVIYQFLTKDQTKRALKHLTDPDVLARNFFTAQVKLLTPTLGQKAILGLMGRDNTDEAPMGAEERANQNWTRCICLTYEDTFLRIAREISRIYEKIFTPHNVRRGISEFFDRVFAEKIRFRTLRLIDPAIILSPNDLHPSKIDRLFRFPVKTAKHTARALLDLWMNDYSVLPLALLAVNEPQRHWELALMTEVTVRLGLLKVSETKSLTLTTVALGDPKGSNVTYRLPKRKACEELFQRKIKRALCGQIANLSDAHTALNFREFHVRRICVVIDQAVRLLTQRTVSFPSFLLLLELLGIDFINDVLPGSTNDMQSNEEEEMLLTGDGTPLDEGDEDFEIWRDYLADVADIPSLKSKLLNVATEDEMLEWSTQENSAHVAETRVSLLDGTELDRNILIKLKIQKAQYTRNINKIRAVFDQIGQGTSFLPADLTDEAVILLLDGRLGLAGTRACLAHLAIDSPDMQVGKQLSEALRLPASDDTSVLHLQETPDQTVERIDWTYYRKNVGWSADLLESYKKLTSSSPGFISKAQTLSFVRLVEAKYIKSDALRQRNWDDEAKQSVPNKGSLGINRTAPQLNEWRAIASLMVTPDMFYRVTSSLRICVSRYQAELFWYLICLELRRTEYEAFLPATNVCGTMTRILYQPVTSQGQKYVGSNLNDIHEFAGCIGYFGLPFVLKAMGLDIPERYVKNIWDDLPKDPLSIAWCLGTNKNRDENESEHDEDDSASKGTNSDQLSDLRSQSTAASGSVLKDILLRVGMDSTGLDPTKGTYVSFKTLRLKLASMFLTGLPPEGLSIFIRQACDLDVEQERIDAAIDKHRKLLNRYGVFKPQALVPILCTLHVGGVSFRMLRGIVDGMRLKLPVKDVKRMFDLLDTNQNKFLELGEILFGFEMLCKLFVTDHITNVLKYSAKHQLRAASIAVLLCITLFAFLTFTVRSFTGMTNGIGNSVQTFLALIGAVAFQNSHQSSDPELEAQIAIQMRAIFGDDFDRRFAAAKQPQPQDVVDPMEATKKNDDSIKLSYILPARCKPKPGERNPCATLYCGDQIFLEPVLSQSIGAASRKMLWSITPRLPTAMGLSFDHYTGIISGKVGSPIGNRAGESRSLTLPPTTYLVSVRLGNRGQAQCHLTLRTMPRPLVGGKALFLPDDTRDFDTLAVEEKAESFLMASRLAGSKSLVSRCSVTRGISSPVSQLSNSG